MHRALVRGFLAGFPLLMSGIVWAQSSTWDPLPFFVPVADASVAYDPIRERIVMFSGFFTQHGTTQNGAGLARSRETREWDGTRWLARRPLVSPPPRASAGMVFDHVRGKIVLFGGTFAGGTAPPYLNDMWEYDGQTWQQIPQAGTWPLPRRYPSMASDPIRGIILLFGGDDSNIGATYRDTWEWDGSYWQQRMPVTVPTARFGAAMAYCYANQRILMLGGGPGLQIDYMYEWDGVNWTDTSNNPTNPPGFTGCLISTPWNGHVIRQFSVGVQNNNYVYYNDTWDFDGSNWSQIVTPSRPGFRNVANTCEFPPRQSVLWANGLKLTSSTYPPQVFGTDPMDREEDPWVLENGDWRRIPTEARRGFPIEATVYDQVLDSTVILANRDFNGPTMGQRMQTWVLEGDRMRQLSLAVNPPYRANPRMARHDGLGRIVLFGGGLYPPNGPADTWVFDGLQWVEDTFTPAPMPTPNGLAMVYDGVRNHIVLMLYGRQDLWRWNGQGWSTWTAGQLPFKPYGILGYDPTRQRLVYFGDLQVPPSTAMVRDQVYEFDGTTWQNLPITTIPPTQMLWTRLTYVPWLGGLVLVPQAGWPGVVGPTWVWNGTNWSTVPVDREMFDGCGSFQGTRAGVTYDAARGELQAFSSENQGDATGSYVWRLRSRTLRLSNHHPRLMERLAFSFAAPNQAGQLGIVLLSGSNHPRTLIGATDGRSLPLANDVFLQISIGLGLWAVLDAQGQATLQLGAIPNDQGLVGITFHAAGVVFNPQTASFSTATNSEPFDINR